MTRKEGAVRGARKSSPPGPQARAPLANKFVLVSTARSDSRLYRSCRGAAPLARGQLRSRFFPKPPRWLPTGPWRVTRQSRGHALGADSERKFVVRQTRHQHRRGRGRRRREARPRERSGALVGGLPALPSNHSHPTHSFGAPAARRSGMHSPGVPFLRIAAVAAFVFALSMLREAAENSTLRAWVQSSFGADAAPYPELTVRSEGFDSLMLARGPGSEPGAFSADQLEHMPQFRWIPHGDEVLFGSAPCERGPGEELGLRLASGAMVWTAAVPQPTDPPHPVRPPSSYPSPTQPTPEPQLSSEEAQIAAQRAARLNKHPEMRQVIECLAVREGSQAALARRLLIRPATLAEYNTGRARGK
eukprot:7382383-Prymnesium_polylepis.1